MNSYQQLQKIFKRFSHLQYIQRILMWDEAVMMPEGAGEARAHALATLSRTMQKMLISKKTKNLIEQAKQEDELINWDESNLKWMEKIYNRSAAIPLQLTEEATKAAIACEQAWRRLRPQNNWEDFAPYLEKSFQYIKEIADRRSEALQLNPYDAMIDEYAPGFSQATIDPIFSDLKTILPSLVDKIIQKQQKHNILIPAGPFPIEKQKMLGLTVMKALGFDFKHGRLDASHHPFCSGGPTDVRITTRYSTDEFIRSLTAICHETGHALYEQGLPPKWLEQPVGHVQSMTMHESQSLLIEMQVCCSLDFYEYVTPLIQNQFGKQKALLPANLHNLVTQVKPGLIRVDADEVTYPLHVILRYELEKKLFSNEINIKDLPHYWDEMMMKYLGLSTKGNDQFGVMQDVHWTAGAYGYFPAYTLGRLIAAQIFATYQETYPDYRVDIKQGNFHTLKNWLEQNVYSYAALFSTKELLLKLTGSDLNSNYFINHLEQRYLDTNSGMQTYVGNQSNC